MAELNSISPEEEEFFRTLHAEAKSNTILKGGFLEFQGCYGTPAHKSLAEKQYQNAEHKKGYRKEACEAGIFSEVVAGAVLGHPVETIIKQYTKGIGGDGGIDGYIHGVPYDIKTSKLGEKASFHLTNGKSSPWRKSILIISKWNQPQPKQARIVFYGYAWRHNILPLAYQCPSYKNTRVDLDILLKKRLLEPDLTKLRDGTELYLPSSWTLQWDDDLKQACWEKQE